MRTNMTYQGFKILIVKFVTWIKVFFFKLYSIFKYLFKYKKINIDYI